MPDAPLKITSPQYAQAEAKAKAASPLYWCHSSVTVYEYRHLDRAGQDAINRECRAIEQARRATR